MHDKEPNTEQAYHSFVKLVSDMRYSQNRYKETKRAKTFQQIVDLEYRVDEHIKKVMQPSLNL